MKCSIQRSKNRTFHLSPNENICSMARMRKHYLFYMTCTKIQNFKTNLKEKLLKMTLAQAKYYSSRASNSPWDILRVHLRQAKHTRCACCICAA